MRDEKLTRIYRETDRDLALFYYRVHGTNNEMQVPAPMDRAVIAGYRQELAELTRRVEELEAPDGVYALVRHHFTDFLSTIRHCIDDNEQRPEAMLTGCHYQILNIARRDDRENEVRCRDLVDFYRRTLAEEEAYGRILMERYAGEERRAAASRLQEGGEAMRTELGRLEDHFPEFTEEQKNRILETGGEYAAFLDRLAARLQDIGEGEAPLQAAREGAAAPESAVGDSALPRSSEEAAALPAGGAPSMVAEDEDLSVNVKMDPEAYRLVLADQQGVDLDELLAWHHQEIARTRSECFRIARELALPDTDPDTMEGIKDILFRFEPPCETGEEMHARCNEYLKRTRALAHRVIRLPEEEQAVCVPIPAIYAAGYPWGGYEGGDFRKPPYIGKMFLNQYNTRNISDGWIKLNSLHECYPGHHCQYVRAAIDPIPETVKIGSRLIALLEGTCLRTEGVYGDIFEEDPVFRLFTAYRRHHASVRICVDLMLFYYGRPLQRAVEMYQRELGFDYVTARAQVQAHQNAPGYFTAYYYGMKKMMEWEKELGYETDAYSEILFSAGYISMDSLHMLVQLTPEEQQRYFTEFPTMLSHD